MHYCINSLLEINNEIMQYCIIINDIALLQMPGRNQLTQTLKSLTDSPKNSELLTFKHSSLTLPLYLMLYHSKVAQKHFFSLLECLLFSEPYFKKTEKHLG